jgi:hypothetical protein
MAEAFFLSYDADEDKTMVDEELYRQLIGSLLYLALWTRPDILVAVSILACFSQSPTAYFHRGAKRVVRYLRGTTDIALVYRSGTTEINAFVDSDYAGNTIDRKSVSDTLSSSVMRHASGDQRNRSQSHSRHARPNTTR